jgi:hypothetical protein
MRKWILAAALVVAAAGPALAADWRAERQGIVLPPERHVIELAHPPYSGNFIINDAHFSAETAECAAWTAGDRVVLRAGDWHGYCSEAIFYNVSRRSTCTMACGWHWPW